MTSKTSPPKFPYKIKTHINRVSRLSRTAATNHVSAEKTICGTSNVFRNIRSLAAPEERTRTDYPDKWTSIC